MSWLTRSLTLFCLASFCGCSIVFGILSNRDECEDGSECSPDGRSSLVCSQNNLFSIDCGENLCNEDTGECNARCGDGFPAPGEDCEGPGEAGCNMVCHLVPVCGNSIIEPVGLRPEGAEQCDDGNTINGDGCDALCHLELLPEVEPNDDDGPPEIGGGSEGNDFDLNNAQGPFTKDTFISFQISVSGDEDAFQVQNTSSAEVDVRVDVFDQFIVGNFDDAGALPGFGRPCAETDGGGSTIVMNIRDESGALVTQNFTKGTNDLCPGLTLTLQPNEVIYLHFVEEVFDSNTSSGNNFLFIDFDGKDPVCGDGILDPTFEECDPFSSNCEECRHIPQCGDNYIDNLESCDDGNITDGDGCDAQCQREDALLETEPNQQVPAEPGSSSLGNDVDPATAEGPFTQDVLLVGVLGADGDEDLFRVSNPNNSPQELRLQTSSPVSGLGRPCSPFFGGSIQTDNFTVLNLYSAQGLFLFQNDNFDDVCSRISFTLAPQGQPGSEILVHVLPEVNAATERPYLLQIDFVECGNGEVEFGEECEPPGSAGCTADCQRVAVCGDGILDFPEEHCEDGDTLNGDDCPSDCLFPEAVGAIPEEEPNDLLSLPNDRLQDVPGPFTDDVLLIGIINTRSDADALFIQNTSSQARRARVEIGDPLEGLAGDCNSGVRPVFSLDRLDGGTISSLVSCAGFTVTLTPGEQIIAEVRFFNFLNSGALPMRYLLSVDFIECGNGDIEFLEECEPPNSASCDAQCQRVAVCGDGLLDFPEGCDDGNTQDNDGCAGDCAPFAVITETEPNEDGTPSLNNGIDGNDFSTTNAEGPFSASVALFGALTPTGDEDIIEIQNTAPGLSVLRLDTFDTTIGIGVSCGGIFVGNNIDTAINVRDAGGNLLAQNDDRVQDQDSCSGLNFILQPQQTVFVQVLDFQAPSVAQYVLLASLSPVICGDGALGIGESCDDGNALDGDGCSSVCAIEDGFVCLNGPPSVCHPIVCGDGFTDFPESCDDGNTLDGDACPSDCAPFDIIIETEPNDDGVLSVTSGFNGGDFSSVNADGPFSATSLLGGTINPVGDEDVFAFSNPGAGPLVLRLDTFDADLGVGVSCGDINNGGIDTVINLRDASGALFAQNDERVTGFDSCSGLQFTVAPGQTVFAQVLEFGEDKVINGYFLQASFIPIVCGDGVVVGTEQCDDGNEVGGDGCSAICQIEGVGFDCPPNQTLIQFAATDVPKSIPDNSPVGVLSTINVADNRIVKKVVVAVDNVTHTFAGDLRISIVPPSAGAVLISNNRGFSGDNYINTIFDDACSTVNGPIASGVAPFTGCFSPDNPLSPLNNQAANGAWSLKIEDTAPIDAGVLNAWTLGLCVQ